MTAGKGIAPLVAGFMLLAVLGTILLTAGRLDRRIADAGREFAAQHYERANTALDAAERDLSYGRWLPWVGRALADVRTRRAAIRYWSGQYDRIVPDGSDAAAAASDNVDLQLIAANAVYRRGQPKATDRRTALEALQAAADAYLMVLRNSSRNEAAAYNYEYVVRTREDIDKGRRAADLTDKAPDGPAGRKGGPPPEEPKRDLKLLVPLDPSEIDKGLEPGKGGARERKG